MRLKLLLPILLTSLIVAATWLGSTSNPESSTQVPVTSAPPHEQEKIQPAAVAFETVSDTATPSKLLPDHELHLWQAVGTAARTPLQAATRGETRLMEVTAQPYDLQAELKAGDVIAIPLMNGEQAVGTVNLVQPDLQGWVRVGGHLAEPSTGTFYLASDGQHIHATLLLPERQQAYLIEPQEDGRTLMKEVPLSSVVCHQAGQPTANSETSSVTSTVPRLSSRPSATAVIYLDLDGETVTDPAWNGGQEIQALSPNLTISEIISFWRSVAEDFAPFDIDVTTDLARYEAAPVQRRTRCIITPSNGWYGDVSGVAMLSSFANAGTALSSTVPCWCFNAKAVTASHEVGHTLGLSHDGLTNPATAYYTGHGTGTLSWGPIMGDATNRTISQWSKGEYANANQTQDDVAIIAGSTNGFGFVPDEAGDTRETATPIPLPDTRFVQEGIISQQSDVDYYQFTTEGGALQIIAIPNPDTPNLDIDLELQDANGEVLASSRPAGASNKSVSSNFSSFILWDLEAGTYYLKVQGSANGDPLTTGYSSYGSLGPYTLRGFIHSLTAPSVTPGKLEVADIISGYTKLDFGSKAVNGLSLTRHFIVYNNGSTPISGITAQVTGSGADHFSVGALGKTSLEPGGLTTFSIRFTPGAPGIHTVDLHVSATGGGSPDVTAQIFAEGTPGVGAPSISNFSTDQALKVGENLVLTGVINGAPPLNVQWLKNGKVISKQTGDSLTFAPVKGSDAGDYQLRITNSLGLATRSCSIGVIDSPPEYFQKKINGGAALTVKTYAPPSATQTRLDWQRDGSSFSPSTPTVTVSLEGTYVCRVTFHLPNNKFISVSTRPSYVTNVLTPELDQNFELDPIFVTQEISIQLPFSHSPTRYMAKGLPPGLTLNPTTGILTGRPTAVRYIKGELWPYVALFTATNAAGKSAHEGNRHIWVKPLPEGFSGIFTGFIPPHPTLTQGLGGTMTVTVHPFGTYSGTAKFGTRSYRFKGSFGYESETWIESEAFIPLKAPLPSLKFHLLSYPDDNRIELSASDKDTEEGLFHATLYRNVWIDPWKKNGFAAFHHGRGTAGILPLNPDPERIDEYPQGEGFLVYTVAHNGTITWQGRLPDGTAIAGSCPQGPEGQFPLYQLLYKNKSYISSQMFLGVSGEGDTQLTGRVLWVKPDEGDRSKGRNYKHGYQLDSMVLGSSYNIPIGGKPSIPFPQAHLNFSSGALSSPLNIPVIITPKLTAQVLSKANNLKISFNYLTGLYSGSFVTEEGERRSSSFQGVFVKRLNRGVGYHLMPALSSPPDTTPKTSPILSGPAIFIPIPDDEE
ncbi:Putative Ig domain-containing protein [Prosthecobacter debontii]|uniref:Putative Ig domain-containing protein n=1 Tax=Prosthecobacter debontii TaxID=48467 RepID=A0A1T4XZI8_9BACT|nr:immunoglobulin domain-containing protein [Prosthecobacter debontii]SKA94940.1 Putative Ig domain-containing protein [Prosthecobacter debontii]